MDRTPTLDAFAKVTTAITNMVREVSVFLPPGDLNPRTLACVSIYLHGQYGPHEGEPDWSHEFDGILYQEKGVVCGDIGYSIFKEEIARIAPLDPSCHPAALDAVMGWIAYDPGTVHQRLMDETAERLIEEVGIERFGAQFSAIKYTFEQLQQHAVEARRIVSSAAVRAGVTNVKYNTTFCAGGNNLDYRELQLRQKYPHLVILPGSFQAAPLPIV